MAYKTVKKLLDAYDDASISPRKNKLQLVGSNVTLDVDDEDGGAQTVFEMETLTFIKQLAKLADLKVPIEQGEEPDTDKESSDEDE